MHIALYQKFGFWPGQLTLVMAKAVASAPGAGTLERYSEADSIVQARHLEACRALTDRIFTGLDVTSEIDATHRQNLGAVIADLARYRCFRPSGRPWPGARR